jgi:hypothetical protein
MLLPEQPLLDGQEAGLPDGARAVEGGSGSAGLDLELILWIRSQSYGFYIYSYNASVVVSKKNNRFCSKNVLCY